MILFDRQWAWRRLAILALTLGAAGLILALAFSAFVAREYDEPTVTLLGAGDGISVIVTDGPARLLIASGDDSAEFGNALSDARPFGHNRIDILLLVGSTNDVTFLTRARNMANARHIEVIGPTSLPAALGLPDTSLLASPRRFALSNDTTVTVEASFPSNGESSTAQAWRVIVEHRGVRIAVLSDSEADNTFQNVDFVTALAVAGRKPIAHLSERAPLVVIRGSNVSSELLRNDVADDQLGKIWTYRLFDGNAISFRFTDNGLKMPNGGIAVDSSIENEDATPSE